MSVKFVQLTTKVSAFDSEEIPKPWGPLGPAPGMSDVIQTEANTFIVVDGGNPEDGAHLVEVLQELAGGEKPHVKLWIITHPHGDHYLALESVSKDDALRSALIVDQFCYQIPAGGVMPGGEGSCAGDLKRIEDSVARFGASVMVPHTGDRIDIDGVGLWFVASAEDVRKTKDSNELSLVFQVIGPKRTVMVTGDAYEKTLWPSIFRYWDALKSDICQLAHHAVNGGSEAFYEKVHAKTVLLPMSVTAYRRSRDPAWGMYFPSMYAERLAERCIKAYEGDVTLEI